MFTPDNVTGTIVLEVRTRHRLSRERFSELAGFTGKSTARLHNIEKKDSWKDGDRTAVARVLNELEGGHFDPRYHTTQTTATEVAEPPVTVLIDADDDPEDLLVSVTTPIPVEASYPRVPSLVEPTPDAFVTDDDGIYRVSNGELQTWKRCRRKWWLAWYRRLALRTESFVGVRAVGDRIHRALQRWYVPEGQRRVDPRDALERVIVDDWTKIAQLARERDLPEERLQEYAAEFAASTNLERAMVEGYVQWLEETGADAELRVIASETPLTTDLEVTVAGEVRPVRLIGLLDTRVYRVTDGVRLFIDHKSCGDLQSPAVTLPQNEQMLQYHLIEWLNTAEGEARCDGALYNMIKRTKRTARAKPPFFDRVEVRHNVHELESYKRRTLATTRDILRAMDALDHDENHLEVVYPTPKSDCRWDCDFFVMCNMLDDGSPGVDDITKMLYEERDPRARYAKTDERTD